MRKVMFVLVSILILSLLTAACSAGNKEANNPPAATNGNAKQGASEEANKPKENITLNIAVWDDKLKQTLDQVIEIYKKDHSHVDVQVTITPNKDYFTKVQTSLVGGSGPDLFMMNGPNFNKFASLGLLTNLEENIGKDKLDLSVYPQGINELYQIDKQSYGIPFFLGSIGLFYNKELFDQANIPYPDATWNWDTLKENAAKLTNKEKKVFGYVAVNSDQVGYYPLVYQAGGQIISADKKSSGLALPETKQAIQFMKDLMDEGISPSAQQQLETDPLQLFGSGGAAMYPGGSFDASNLTKLLGDKLGVAALPQGKQQGFYVHGSSWVINKASKHQQEAWELLRLLTGKEGQELLAKNAVNFPAYTDYVKVWAESIPSLDMSPFITSLDHTAPYPVSINTAEWAKVLKEAVTEALLGSKPVGEALDQAAEQMNQILSKE
ncbi:ABC transporter substrate-binding protein [Paenibacillus sp. GCM10023252]|uniref:ABC transporter substrate-binding protein n=1 Tax=Paenibacillus sp. GCM10023252 TaxID=3252649 RepID=UPI00361B98AA